MAIKTLVKLCTAEAITVMQPCWDCKMELEKNLLLLTHHKCENQYSSKLLTPSERFRSNATTKAQAHKEIWMENVIENQLELDTNSSRLIYSQKRWLCLFSVWASDRRFECPYFTQPSPLRKCLDNKLSVCKGMVYCQCKGMVYCQCKGMVYCQCKGMVYCQCKGMVYCQWKGMVYCQCKGMVYCQYKGMVYCQCKGMVYCQCKGMVYCQWKGMVYCQWKGMVCCQCKEMVYCQCKGMVYCQCDANIHRSMPSHKWLVQHR